MATIPKLGIMKIENKGRRNLLKKLGMLRIRKYIYMYLHAELAISLGRRTLTNSGLSNCIVYVCVQLHPRILDGLCRLHLDENQLETQNCHNLWQWPWKFGRELG